jgi:hypothetical protein
MLGGSVINTWSFGVAVIALIFGGLGVLYTRRALFPPQRKLTVAMLASAPLLSQSPVARCPRGGLNRLDTAVRVHAMPMIVHRSLWSLSPVSARFWSHGDEAGSGPCSDKRGRPQAAHDAGRATAEAAADAVLPCTMSAH